MAIGTFSLRTENLETSSHFLTYRRRILIKLPIIKRTITCFQSALKACYRISKMLLSWLAIIKFSEVSVIHFTLSQTLHGLFNRQIHFEWIGDWLKRLLFERLNAPIPKKISL